MKSDGIHWNRRFAYFLVCLLLAGVPCTSSSSEKTPIDINQLRASQQVELDKLKADYDRLAREKFAAPDGSIRTGDPGYTSLRDEYISRAKQIKSKYASMDTRLSDFAAISAKPENQVVNTGSRGTKPLVDVRADVDTASPRPETVDTVRERWEKQYGKNAIIETPDGQLYNTATDHTHWKPPTEAAAVENVHNRDAYHTEGGLEATGNRTAIRDERGFVLDNRTKLEGARADGSIKDIAKGVDKAASASGTRVLEPGSDGELVVGRSAGIKNQNPDFYRQAESLRNYGDAVEAGIVDLGDSPQVAKDKINKWQEQVQKELVKAQEVADRRSALRDNVREQNAEAYRRQKDPEIQKIAENVEADRVKVKNSNQHAESLLEQARAKPTADKPYTGGWDPDKVQQQNAERREFAEKLKEKQKPVEVAPGEPAATVPRDPVPSAKPVAGKPIPSPEQVGSVVGTGDTPVSGGNRLPDKPVAPIERGPARGGTAGDIVKVPEGMVPGEKPLLAGRVGQVVDGLGAAAPIFEAAAGAAGRAADQNRSMNAGDVATAALDGTGIKPAFELGHSISSEEVQRMHLENRSAAESLGRTGLRMTDAVARGLINDPVDRNIKEEEARARRAGEEPSYMRSAALGAAEVAGNLTGIGMIARGGAELTTLDERRMLAAQREKMAGYVESNTAASTARIRGLQQEIEQLSLGNVKDPAVMARINDRMKEYNTEQQHLQALSGMAQRTLGDANPDKAVLPGKALQTLPRPNDFDDYIRQNVTDRGGSMPVKVNVPDKVNAPGGTATMDPGAAAMGMMPSLSDLVTAAGSALNEAGNKIKDRAETELITGGVDALRSPQGQNVLRGAVAGLSAEDPELRRVRQLYNNAPEGSAERTKLNDLFVKLRDGKDKQQAQQELAQRWAASPLSSRAAAEAASQPPARSAAEIANALPSKADMETSLSESENNLRAHNEYINKLREQNASPEDIASAEWIRDQERNRRDQLRGTLANGEFREAQVAALAGTNAPAASAAQPVTPGAGVTSPTSPMEESTGDSEPAAASEPRNPWTREELENDNYNMGRLIERGDAGIKNLEENLAQSRDGSERARIKEQLDKLRAERARVQERIDTNNEMLVAQGVAPGRAPAPEEPVNPGYTQRELEGDNENMEHLAQNTDERLEKLRQQIAQSRNGTERRQMEEELQRLSRERAALEERSQQNNTFLRQMGVAPKPPEPEPVYNPGYTREELANDNANMANLAESNAERIKGLQDQITASRNGTERRRMQEELARMRREQQNIDARIDENTAMMNSPPPAGDDAMRRSEPDAGDGSDLFPGRLPASLVDGMASDRQSLNERRFSDGMNMMNNNTAVDNATRSGDRQNDQSGRARNAAGEIAQNTLNRSADDTAGADRNNNWSAVLANSVADGLQQGMSAAGSAVGTGAAGHATRNVFGGGNSSRGNTAGSGATGSGSSSGNTGSGAGGGGQSQSTGATGSSGTRTAGSGNSASGNNSGSGSGDNSGSSPSSKPPSSRTNRGSNDGTVTVTSSAAAGGAGGTAGAAGSGAGGFAEGAQDKTISGSSQLGGKTVTGVSVSLTYQAFGVPDAFSIIYEGKTIAGTGSTSGSGTITGSGTGTSPEVTVRVVSSKIKTTEWNWQATVKFQTGKPAPGSVDKGKPSTVPPSKVKPKVKP